MIDRARPYPEMRDSGAEWLGEARMSDRADGRETAGTGRRLTFATPGRLRMRSETEP